MSRPFGFERSALLLALLTVALGLAAERVDGQTLRGSAASLDRQNEQANAHSFTYLATVEELRRFVDAGYLVPVRPNRDFDVHNVSFPYARPEVRLFVERLASQYRSACGEKLVVTSLTRPRSHQPPNASARSVHPTGMALDLRRSQNARCRSWLEQTLLSLEAAGVLEAIYERNPPHYHVALYPRPYVAYLQRRVGTTTVASLQQGSGGEEQLEWVTHRVRRGESLIGIARRYDTTPSRIQAENRLRSTRILAGQDLRIPVYRSVPQAPVRAVQAAAGASDVDDDAPGGPSGSGQSALSAEPGLTHTVRRGESLWSIARLHDVPEAELRRANGLSGTRIVVGQELAIPGADTADDALEHRVARGDTLWSIARRYGVSVEEIQRHNGIGGPRIQPGQTLLIPVGR